MDDSLEAVGGEIDAELFGKSHERAPQSRQQKRANRQQFARQQILEGFELNLSLEKLRDYQQKDNSLTTVRNLVSKTDSHDSRFFEKSGLVYRRWIPKKST